VTVPWDRRPYQAFKRSGYVLGRLGLRLEPFLSNGGALAGFSPSGIWS